MSSEINPHHSHNYILVVGSGNGQYVLQLSEAFEVGQKHTVDPSLFIGGGGVNQSLKLLKIGYSILPILSIGQDNLGHQIQNKLLEEAEQESIKSEVIKFIQDELFLVPNLKTQLSTIILAQGERTILTEKAQGFDVFPQYLKTRLNQLDLDIKNNISAVVIGNIYADHPETNSQNPGECTKYLINLFQEKKCLIYANPGKSQFCLGYSFWRDYFKKVNLLQFNIREIKQLFGQQNQLLSLTDLIDLLFQEKLNTIITCDKFGVIGIYASEPDKIIFAPPITLAKLIDTTGAGDSFGAGLVSQLYNKPDFSFEEFLQAIHEARIWAAYTCGSVSGKCPTLAELEEFKKIVLEKSDPLEIIDRSSIKPMLQILDKAYL